MSASTSSGSGPSGVSGGIVAAPSPPAAAAEAGDIDIEVMTFHITNDGKIKGTRQLNSNNSNGNGNATWKHVEVLEVNVGDIISSDMDEETRLLPRLERLTFLFGLLRPNSERASVEPIVKYLARDAFLQHRSKHVRFLSSTCLLHKLRVFGATVSEKNHQKIITRAVENLRQVLSTPTTELKPALIEDLVRSLSAPKVFHLIKIMSRKDMDTLFKLLFEAADCAGSNRTLWSVKWTLTELMKKIVREFSGKRICNQLLLFIGQQLLRSDAVGNNAATRAFAQEIITSDTNLDRICRIISHFVAQLLEHANVDLKFNTSQQDSDNQKSETNLLFSLGYGYELYKILPNQFKNLFEQLKAKLENSDDRVRQTAVKYFAMKFREMQPPAANDEDLCERFIRRAGDANVNIRAACLDLLSKMAIPFKNCSRNVAQDVLLSRENEPFTRVRILVVQSVAQMLMNAPKYWTGIDDGLSSHANPLLQCLERKVLDKATEVRQEALNQLNMICRSFKLNTISPQEKENILHEVAVCMLESVSRYCRWTPEDVICLQRVLHTCFGPRATEEENDRMSCVLNKYAKLDDMAKQEFLKVHSTQVGTRQCLNELLDKIEALEPRDPLGPDEDYNTEIAPLVKKVLNFVPGGQKKTSQLMMNFIRTTLRLETEMRTEVRKIINTEREFEERRKWIRSLLRELDLHQLNATLLRAISFLLYQSVLAVLDVNIEIVTQNIKQSTESGTSYTSNLIEISFGFLTDLASLVPTEFSRLCLTDLEEDFTNLIKSITAFTAVTDLQGEQLARVYTYLKLFTRLGESGILLNTRNAYAIATKLQSIVSDGTPKESKAFLRFVYHNFLTYDKGKQFRSIRNLLNGKLNKNGNDLHPTNAQFCTHLTAIGQLSVLMPDLFAAYTKPLMVRLIQMLKEHLQNELANNGAVQPSLFDVGQVTAAIKTVRCWLVGCCKKAVAVDEDEDLVEIIRDILSLFTSFLNPALIRGSSTDPRLWIQITAATSILRLCREDPILDNLTPRQFIAASQAMLHKGTQRPRFAEKLHKYLSSGLPTDFLGYYILCGYEEDSLRKKKLLAYFLQDVVKRFANESNNMFEKVFPLAVAVLVHNPRFSNPADLKQLQAIKICISWFLNAIVEHSDSCALPSCVNLIHHMKMRKIVEDSGSDGGIGAASNTNEKLLAVCKMATELIGQRCQTAKSMAERSDMDDMQVEDSNSMSEKFFERKPRDEIDHERRQEDLERMGKKNPLQTIDVVPTTEKDTRISSVGSKIFNLLRENPDEQQPEISANVVLGCLEAAGVDTDSDLTEQPERDEDNDAGDIAEEDTGTNDGETSTGSRGSNVRVTPEDGSGLGTEISSAQRGSRSRRYRSSANSAHETRSQAKVIATRTRSQTLLSPGRSETSNRNKKSLRSRAYGSAEMPTLKRQMSTNKAARTVTPPARAGPSKRTKSGKFGSPNSSASSQPRTGTPPAIPKKRQTRASARGKPKVPEVAVEQNGENESKSANVSTRFKELLNYLGLKVKPNPTRPLKYLSETEIEDELENESEESEQIPRVDFDELEDFDEESSDEESPDEDARTDDPDFAASLSLRSTRQSPVKRRSGSSLENMKSASLEVQVGANTEGKRPKMSD